MLGLFARNVRFQCRSKMEDKKEKAIAVALRICIDANVKDRNLAAKAVESIGTEDFYHPAYCNLSQLKRALWITKINEFVHVELARRNRNALEEGKIKLRFQRKKEKLLAKITTHVLLTGDSIKEKDDSLDWVQKYAKAFYYESKDFDDFAKLLSKK